MIEMRADEAVRALIEAVFPRPRGEGLLVTLDMRPEHPANERCRVSSNVSFVFERPSNYCKVWTGTTRTAFDIPQLVDWEMVCDHDSCWRGAVSDAISKKYFRQAKEISSKLAPVKMRQSCYVHRVEHVRLAYETINPLNPHKKRLTALEYITR